MERIAFLWKGTGQPVYWRWIFIAMGALVFALALVSLRAARGKRVLPLALILPLTGAGAVYAARLVHWYCRSEEYAGLAAAVTDLSAGGFSLAGALAGGLAVIALLGLIRAVDDLPAFLDDTGAAAALGIAVGRLGDMYGPINHGRIVFENAARHTLPLASPVYNVVTGEYEWRLATFCLQSLWAGVIFLAVTWMILRRRRKKETRPGGAFTLFLTLYCLGQILFESTRYDALFLRSNGFVSMEQILSSAVLLAILLTAARRAAMTGGFSAAHVLWPLLFLAGLGLAGYMEYYVQRHGGAYVLAYSVMAAGLMVTFTAMRLMDRKSREKK